MKKLYPSYFRAYKFGVMSYQVERWFLKKANSICKECTIIPPKEAPIIDIKPLIALERELAVTKWFWCTIFFKVACLAGSNKQESTDKHILEMKIISILVKMFLIS